MDFALRSSHQAIQAVWKWMDFGYNYVVDADIHKYFDNIPHDKLLRSAFSALRQPAVFPDRCLQPHLDQPKDASIGYAP